MKPKVLITGSSGMLGTDLCQELFRDYELYGIDAANNVKDPSSAVVFYKGDITDRENILKIVSRIKPDVIVHTAAYTDVDGCETNKDAAYKVNAEGTENIALACKAVNATLIAISTDFIFDGSKNASYVESDKPAPLSIYGDSKLKGEEAVKNILEKYLILRTSWLYGKNGKNFVDTILSKSGTDRVLKVVCDQTGSPTYTKDLSEAIHILLDKILRGISQEKPGSVYGIYHVSNSGSVSWYEYAKTILRLASAKTEVIPISSAESARSAKRPAMSVLDNSKFKIFTGYNLRYWEDALKDYLKKGR